MYCSKKSCREAVKENASTEWRESYCIMSMLQWDAKKHRRSDPSWSWSLPNRESHVVICGLYGFVIIPPKNLSLQTAIIQQWQKQIPFSVAFSVLKLDQPRNQNAWCSAALKGVMQKWAIKLISYHWPVMWSSFRADSTLELVTAMLHLFYNARALHSDICFCVVSVWGSNPKATHRGNKLTSQQAFIAVTWMMGWNNGARALEGIGCMNRVDIPPNVFNLGK